ncbi:MULTISPECIES: hypothetical protein [unclassified Clostridium]|uniref:hypothetical protein n=1 Tax=unclassified Clostridium TaxID=2614128 RepID=UPI0032171649
MKYIRKVKAVRTANNFNRYTELIGKLNNLEVRIWYNKRDKNIINEIDKSLSIKEQAKQAHFLRNKYRAQARKLMADRMLAEKLSINNTNLPFEYYENKYLNQGYNDNELYEKIIAASTRTNKMVNVALGIG